MIERRSARTKGLQQDMARAGLGGIEALEVEQVFGELLFEHGGAFGGGGHGRRYNAFLGANATHSATRSRSCAKKRQKTSGFSAVDA